MKPLTPFRCLFFFLDFPSCFSYCPLFHLPTTAVKVSVMSSLGQRKWPRAGERARFDSIVPASQRQAPPLTQVILPLAGLAVAETEFCFDLSQKGSPRKEDTAGQKNKNTVFPSLPSRKLEAAALRGWQRNRSWWKVNTCAALQKPGHRGWFSVGIEEEPWQTSGESEVQNSLQAREPTWGLAAYSEG